MFEGLKSIFDALNFSPSKNAALAIICLAILFLGQRFDILGISQLAKDHAAWFGFGALIFGGLWVTYVMEALAKLAAATWRRQKWKRKLKENLRSMTEDEKKILRYYICHQTKTSSLRALDGVVQGLVAKRILYRPSNNGHLWLGTPHNIADAAWDYLNKNNSLLDGDTNYFRYDRSVEDYLD